MEPFDLSAYAYELPPECIATRPAERRDASRLMLLPRDGGRAVDHVFSDLPDLLRPGDCLVLNDSRVIPARLRLRRAGGGRCELLLTEPVEAGRWGALVRPARKLPVGAEIELPAGAGRALIECATGPRTRTVRFELAEGLTVHALLERHGEVPLPPYILRQRAEAGRAHDSAEDRERYQTVYARPPQSVEAGEAAASVAAPTAGLHFTPEVLERLERGGIQTVRVTLHVGLGTFAPLEREHLREGRLHAEGYEVSPGAAAALEAARSDPERRVIAVGTTSVRVLETVAAGGGPIVAGAGRTEIFIRPGHVFQAVEGLLTNFHLPASSLLMLAAAFAGRERILEAYRQAVVRGYRFYSYGDAMLIV